VSLDSESTEITMPGEDLPTLIRIVRTRMAELLVNGEPTRATALLLVDLEEEEQRRRTIDADLQRRAAALGRADVAPPGADVWILDRPLPEGLDRRAHVPRTGRAPTPAEAARGVVFAYATANPTFYRAVIDRLAPGESFRMETQHGTFEMTRDDFHATLPAITRSASYQHGSDTAPGAARYVVGRAPRSLAALRAPE
jgi:hypothetical protein